MAEGLLYRRRVWTRQPSDGIGLNRVRGWQAGWAFNSLAERGGSGPVTLGTGGSRLVRADGVNLSVRNAVNLGRAVLNAGQWDKPGAGDFTVAIKFRSVAMQYCVIGRWNTGASPSTCDWYVGSGDLVNTAFVVACGSTTYTASVAASWAANGEYALIARRRGTTITVDRINYADGSRHTGTTTNAGITTINSNSSRALKLGEIDAAASYNSELDSSVVAIANRAIGDAEVESWFRNPWQSFAPANSPVFYSLPGGGSTYPVSLTANGTISASDIRSILRIQSASSTSSASMTRVRALLRDASATATASASASKHVSLERAAAAAGTASVSTIRSLLSALSASSTVSTSLSKVMAIARTVTASATVTAAMTRVVGLVASASTTASAVRTLVVSLTRSATATGAASLAQVKAVLRTLSTTATASAALARDLWRMSTATVTVTALGSRVISLARTASSTATAVRLMIVGMARSASATASAVLTTVKQTARLLSAAATSTATLAKLLQKRLVATPTIQAVLTMVSSAAQQGQIAVDRLRIIIRPALRAIRRIRDG